MSFKDMTDEQLGLLTKAMEEAGFTLDEIVAKTDKVAAGMDKITERTRKQNAHLQERISLLDKQEESLRAQGEWTDAINQKEKARLLQAKNRAKMLRETGILDQEQYEQRLLDIQAEEEREDAAHGAKDAAVGFAASMTGVSNAWKSNTLIGQFMQGDFEENILRAASGLKENFSAANMLGSSLMKVQESTMAMVLSADAQFANINKLTGGTGEYNDMIMDTMSNNQQFNVGVDDAAESVGALYEGMSNFSNMSKEAQASAVETTAQLKALGIDAQTSAANFEILNGALGMSAEQAGEVQKDFAAMAADLGVSAAKISKDFERNSDVFTAYGDNAVEVFKETAAAAKATGIEMDALLGITTQMDTFEGAAKSAGQLNAVLGGGLLNSMDLLNASEAERTRMLIGSVEASGKSWTSMSKFEKQAVMNAAGVKDMTTANKLFGQSLAEFDAAQAKVEDNAEAQEKLAERAAAATNMQEKLKRIFEQFAVAVQPIISFVHTLMDGLLALNDMTGGMFIPTMIALLGVYKIWSFMNKRAVAESAAQQTMLFQEAMIKMSTATATGTLATAQGVQASTAAAGAGPSRALAGGIRSIGQAAMTYLPAIFALGMALLGLGLAIAAPMILIAVIIWSLKDLVIAFLEVPDAIAPALLGMAAFIGIVAIGLPIIAMAIVGFFTILTGAIGPVMALTPVLPQMVGALLGLGVALWILGKAIKQFVGDDMPGAMALAIVSLIAFGIGLGIAEKFIGDNAIDVGIAIGVLGIGLLLLGKGVKEFNDVTWGGIGKMIVSLIVMGVMLKVAAKFMETSAWQVGLAVGVLGLGLLILGMGVKQFNDVTWEGIAMMVVSLIVLGLMLKPAGWALFDSAMIVGFAAMVLGAGLWMLGKGIQEFMDIGPGMMIGLAVALVVFGWALIPAGLALALAGVFLLYGALMVTPALLLLSLALKPWMDMDLEKIRGIGGALNDMTDGMVWAGIKMALAGYFMLPGAILLSGALAWLWLGLAPIIDKLPALEGLRGLGGVLNDMTKGMVWAGLKMAIAGMFMLPGAVLLAGALMWLWLGLQPWMDGSIDYNMLPTLGWRLAEFAAGLVFAGWMMAVAAIPFFFGAVLLSIGMLILNKPLAEFANTLAVLAGIAPEMPAIATGLLALGRALPGFGWGIFKLGLAASLPFFKTGLKTLGRGLRIFATAISGIPEEKAKALGQLFEGMALFKTLSGVGKIFRELGWGLAMIGWGLHQMPEGEKVISFSYAADALAQLAEASVGVSAEQVVNVQGLADAARSYAWSSRLMRSSDTDALVAALKEVVGLSKSAKAGGGAGGQDVVLEIDGKEFARAVSAAIDSKHNLPF